MGASQIWLASQPDFQTKPARPGGGGFDGQGAAILYYGRYFPIMAPLVNGIALGKIWVSEQRFTCSGVSMHAVTLGRLAKKSAPFGIAYFHLVDIRFSRKWYRMATTLRGERISTPKSENAKRSQNWHAWWAKS